MKTQKKKFEIIYIYIYIYIYIFQFFQIQFFLKKTNISSTNKKTQALPTLILPGQKMRV
jgi:hypothetical protein